MPTAQPTCLGVINNISGTTALLFFFFMFLVFIIYLLKTHINYYGTNNKINPRPVNPPPVNPPPVNPPPIEPPPTLQLNLLQLIHPQLNPLQLNLLQLIHPQLNHLQLNLLQLEPPPVEPPPVEPPPPVIHPNLEELEKFEQWFKTNLSLSFSQKSEKIANPTRQWNDQTVFDGLDPWNNVPQFGTVCHTLIGYCVRYNNSTDALFNDATLASNLINGLRIICDKLPDPPPRNKAPWGPVADWYHFTITLPEVFMNITIVLNKTTYYKEAVDLTVYWLGLYLPTAVNSLGWHRVGGNSMRMGAPYIYSQMLRGHFLDKIKQEPGVKEVLETVSFPYKVKGDGLHVDSIYIDHLDVRAYGYLINSFFTFAFYNYYFGDDTINNVGLTKSIQNVASPEGIVVPGVMSRTGTMYSNVIGNFVDYPLTVHSADYSKVLTKLSDTYYGSVVGATDKLAYYEADPTNNIQAPLWTMTRRLWNRKKRIINYNSKTMPFESGLILQSANGIMSIPSTTTSTQSFRPLIGKTAIAKTDNCGAILIHAKYAEMNNLEFKSCTLFYDHGMFQLYYDVGVTPDSLNNVNSRMVVLARESAVDTGDETFQKQRENNNNNSDGTTFNGVTCYRVPITGINVPSLSVRSTNGVDLVEQIISFQNMYINAGSACYKLNIEGYTDTLRAFLVGENKKVYVNIDNNRKAMFDYPWLMVKEDSNVAFMSAEEQDEISNNYVTEVLSLANERKTVVPVNCSQNGQEYKLKDKTSSLQFIFTLE
ncbi:ODV-e66b [Pieris rapae granulovirus Wuhan]|uniref:ODV-e66b n=1 Tax=Pieris rapae granulovirus Wuhan TaxID=2848030 RepID=D2J4L1_9BBAC|nr:ODV-e66b [Betabaculovirus arrapae]ACZ63530.1 ODV-e66b [Betabaculovirus arrapae]